MIKKISKLIAMLLVFIFLTPAFAAEINNKEDIIENYPDVEVPLTEEDIITPEIELYAQDYDKSTKCYTTWEKELTYDANRAIPCKAEGTIANNMYNYSSYYYRINLACGTAHDFDMESIRIYALINGEETEITKGFEIIPNYKTLVKDGSEYLESVDIEFTDLKQAVLENGESITSEYNIIVYYAIALLDTERYSEGYQTSASVTASENFLNPGANKTWDESSVSLGCHCLTLDLFDINNQRIYGGTFTIYEVDPDGTLINGREFVDFSTRNNDGVLWIYTGIGNGRYALTETAPDGYTAIEPIYFTINGDSSDDIIVETDNDRIFISNTFFSKFGCAYFRMTNDRVNPETGITQDHNILMLIGTTSVLLFIVILARRLKN